MKIKSFIKDNKKIFVGILIGMLISSGSVYAAIIKSKNVSYDNSSSKLTSTNIQGTIDEVYKVATDELYNAQKECPEGYDCLSYFQNDSWKTIESNIKKGNSSRYAVGNTKEIDMGSYGKHTLRIANISTCPSYVDSETACGFVVEFEDIIDNRSMMSTNTNVGGWPASEIRTYLNDTIFKALPDDLKSIIADTKVISGYGSTVEDLDSNNFISNDKLYLLSAAEIWPDCRMDSAYAYTRQLDYYKLRYVTEKNYSSLAKGDAWLLRTALKNDDHSFYSISGNGYQLYNSGNVKSGISPAFRIE